MKNTYCIVLSPNAFLIYKSFPYKVHFLTRVFLVFLQCSRCITAFGCEEGKLIYFDIIPIKYYLVGSMSMSLCQLSGNKWKKKHLIGKVPAENTDYVQLCLLYESFSLVATCLETSTQVVPYWADFSDAVLLNRLPLCWRFWVKKKQKNPNSSHKEKFLSIYFSSSSSHSLEFPSGSPLSP